MRDLLKGIVDRVCQTVFAFVLGQFLTRYVTITIALPLDSILYNHAECVWVGMQLRTAGILVRHTWVYLDRCSRTILAALTLRHILTEALNLLFLFLLHQEGFDRG